MRPLWYLSALWLLALVLVACIGVSKAALSPPPPPPPPVISPDDGWRGTLCEGFDEDRGSLPLRIQALPAGDLASLAGCVDNLPHTHPLKTGYEIYLLEQRLAVVEAKLVELCRGRPCP